MWHCVSSTHSWASWPQSVSLEGSASGYQLVLCPGVLCLPDSQVATGSCMGSVIQTPTKLKSLEALEFEYNYDSPHFHRPQTPLSTGEKDCNSASSAAPSKEAQSRSQHKPGPDTSYPRPLARSLPAKQALGNVPLESWAASFYTGTSSWLEAALRLFSGHFEDGPKSSVSVLPGRTCSSKQRDLFLVAWAAL